MTISQFWELIEATGVQARGEAKRQAKLIRAALEAMGEKEIVSFEEHLRARLREAYTFDVMAAAFIIMSYVSDDTFEDFRAWLVAQGRERFERAVERPESIAEFLKREEVEEVRGEGLLLAASGAYERKTGRDDFGDRVKGVGDPKIRQDWPESRAAFRERYPVLYDAFWNQERIAKLHA